MKILRVYMHRHTQTPPPPPTEMPMPAEKQSPYPAPTFPPPGAEEDEAWVWAQILGEARRDAEAEPILASSITAAVLSHASLPRSLSFHLANKLATPTLPATLLYDLFVGVLASRPDVRAAVVADLVAVRRRDPACTSFCHCLLNFKGFLALQAQRISHVLWHEGRRPIALALQSMIADSFAVDIHPAATIGKAVLLDHATGIVVGETAVIGNDVSILHHVTLGGSGKVAGDRHPKVGDGVLIGAGATVLGKVKVGNGAKIGAGSLVLSDVPAWTTIVGIPARAVGLKEDRRTEEGKPGKSMDHTSEWSDYVI